MGLPSLSLIRCVLLGLVELHWFTNKAEVRGRQIVGTKAPVVIIFPTLNGLSVDYPEQTLVETFLRKGWHVVVYCRRGTNVLELDDG